MKKSFCLLVILFFSLFLVNVFFLTSAYADEYKPYLLVKFGDIEGGSAVIDYENWSEATGISMGISSDCHQLGGGACRAFFDELTITKYAYIDGPALAGVCATGTLQSQVRIVSFNKGAKDHLLWEIKLEAVLISGISSGINSTDGRLMESIELKPSKITWIYYVYNEKGEPQVPNTTVWDIVNNIITP